MNINSIKREINNLSSAEEILKRISDIEKLTFETQDGRKLQVNEDILKVNLLSAIEGALVKYKKQKKDNILSALDEE